MAFLRRHRLVLTVAGTVAALWICAAAWLLRGAGNSLADGRDELDEARRGATPASLLDPTTESHLVDARGDFAQARKRLRSPVLMPLRVVPVVGRHLRSADRVVSSIDKATAVAQSGIDRLDRLSKEPMDSGPARLEAITELGRLMADTRVAMKEVDPGSPSALITPLADAVTDVARQRDDTLATLERAERATAALRDVMAGPSPYLLLGANNGEMRAGSGMFLSAAVVNFEGGTLRLGEVRPTQELILPAGTVAVGEDLRRNWPWLDPGRDFRNLGLTADFPQSAEPATAMWPHVPDGGPVAGVIAVDIDALRALLGVVGPVEVDGVTYDVDSVRGELLRNQYGRFGDGHDARDRRRDALGTVARAVFERIESGGWKLDEMATALTTAVQGRHLMVWSVEPSHAEAWAGVGADGHLTDRSLSVALVNRGANKADSFVDTTLTVEVEPGTGDRQTITLTYEISNTTPPDGPTYVVGPNIEGMVAGEYRGIVVVNLPAGTTDVEIEGVRPTLSGLDGPTVVVGGEVTVASGGTTKVVVTAHLGRGVEEVTLEPSARIPRTRLVLGGREPTVDRRRTIDLTAPLAAGVAGDGPDAEPQE